MNEARKTALEFALRIPDGLDKKGNLNAKTANKVIEDAEKFYQFLVKEKEGGFTAIEDRYSGYITTVGSSPFDT